ncbi:MAG: hypothetical protein H3C48_20610 [Chitinophagaceae bacterium]|nr:hypothetical protein [Chitinophagaceae bacterium]
MPVKLRHFLLLALIICLCVTCGKDNPTPEPQLVPISSIFKLYHIEAGDSTIAGDGSLDQTTENKVKVTIKLNADFRKPSGDYNVSIHQLSNPDALSRVVTMPANVSSWQSDNILSATGSAFKHEDLYEGTTRYVKISDGTKEVAAGRWNVLP